jgi:transposase
MPRIHPGISLTKEQSATLHQIATARSTPQHWAAKADAILRLAAGEEIKSIAKEFGYSRTSISKWRDGFLADGVEGLTSVRPGRGRKATISPEVVTRIVDLTRHTCPVNATHWTCRTMARFQGVSPATVQRIWDVHGLQPHRTETFKLSTDKAFVEKLTDVVGLYMNPPDKAIVLCVDEKSQIQALDRTQPGLPMKRGRCGTMTHDYKRNGTTTLFAALNTLDGKVIGQCFARHRHIEYLTFLRRLDREFPKSLQLHLIVDNYGTHKHPKVKEWLAQHPRFHIHFTPTSSSWLNLVELWFRDLTQKRLRRGVFQSVPQLIATISAYTKANNDDPVPFAWSASVASILKKIAKCKHIYETNH